MKIYEKPVVELVSFQAEEVMANGDAITMDLLGLSGTMGWALIDAE